MKKDQICKIPVIDVKIVDSWAIDEISIAEILFWNYLEYVPVILRNYKKLNRGKS